MSVLIVGGGIFGQVIARKLRQDGHQVTVFDADRAESGSKPSGGHLKPSWLSFLEKPVMERAFATLDQLYGLTSLKCEVTALNSPKLTTVELLRVDVDTVLDQPVVKANVEKVFEGGLICRMRKEVPGAATTWDTNETRYNGTVIVAAGVWSAELLPQFASQLSARKGMSFVYHGVEKMPTNRIAAWAPYKQVVRTEHGPGRIWIGDGSAIVPRNWDTTREVSIEARIDRHVDFEYTRLQRQRGLRPYMRNGLQKVSDNVWLATGGGKSGMCLAGVYANHFSEVLK